ncbi:hypothetical protein AAW12_02705 [Sphingobacterium sp. Ag1]|uniref:hypothetical protein n=1 Tax=Sphingobacterium sp. Ag1 TaxID=1643451 RepID=UPI0006281B32|nr:hypothetical protein [Sphingobacterium sp. Ag1]KKO92859.1 hypothetical protein AAW12_02705 [Sphingobacterium sp. Ag1]
MKSKSSLALLISLLCLSSCKKDTILVPSENTKLSKKATQTGVNNVVTPYFDWETNTNIALPGGGTRILPWYSSAITAIPSYILNDYKKADGWELVYNLCQTPGQVGQNYFILYNKFTGILRTFYFLNDNVTSGSNGMWGISLTGNNALLNNAGYFASAMDEKNSNPTFISSNITNESIAKTINRGWNAFDTEFTYDSGVTQPVYFFISTYNKNIQDVALTGDLDLNSNGTIVTSSSKNSWADARSSAAKSAGSAAKKYVNDKLSTSASSIIKLAASAISGVVSGGVSELVGAGINLLFGSFIGKKSADTSTTQKLEFKTQGTVSLNGTITGSEATNVSPVANLLLPGTDFTSVNNTLYPYFNKRFGVWNLKKTPKVLMPKTAQFLEGTNDQYIRSVDIDPSSIQVEINPDLLSEISNYTISSDLFYYEKFNNSLQWNGPSGPGIIYNFNQNLAYDDGKNVILKNAYAQVFSGPTPPAQTDPTQDYETPLMNTNFTSNKFVVKVTVTLYPKSGYNQDPIVITRSYLPTYELYD